MEYENDLNNRINNNTENADTGNKTGNEAMENEGVYTGSRMDGEGGFTMRDPHSDDTSKRVSQSDHIEETGQGYRSYQSNQSTRSSQSNNPYGNNGAYSRGQESSKNTYTSRTSTESSPYVRRSAAYGGNSNGGKSQGKKKKSSGTGKKVGISALVAAVFGVVAAVVFLTVSTLGMNVLGLNAGSSSQTSAESASSTAQTTQSDSTKDAAADTDSSASTIKTAATSETAMSAADVADTAMPAMVQITCMSVQEVQSIYGGTQEYQTGVAGTGIIIGENDDEILIATNNHIVEGASDVTVTFVDESSVQATVKGTDSEYDLAVVSVKKSDISEDTLNSISVIQMGDSESLRAGEDVVAIGNALGYGQSVSTGVVSAANRTYTSSSNGTETTYIQTDAAINPGNSGGALLNMEGELIGINDAKDVATDVEGVGYAIPISIAKPVLENLMNAETRTKVADDEAGYLGIASSYSIDQDRAEENNAPTGVYVQYLIDGGAAAKAGIKPGDIITKINDVKVSDMDSLKEELAYHAAGETVQVTVSRYGDSGYEEKTFEVTLQQKSTSDDVTSSSDESQSNNNGTNGGSFFGGSNGVFGSR